MLITACGEGNGNPLQYSCLENPLDGGALLEGCSPWGFEESDTTERLHFHFSLSITFTFHFHALEKEMATHFRVLAWRIPGMAEPGGLPSMGSHRVKHNWRHLAAAAAAAAATAFSGEVHLGLLSQCMIICYSSNWKHNIYSISNFSFIN